MGQKLWRCEYEDYDGDDSLGAEIYDDNGKDILNSQTHQLRAGHAKRIVACVNGCRGVADPSVIPEMIRALMDLSVRMPMSFLADNPEINKTLRRMLSRPVQTKER